MLYIQALYLFLIHFNLFHLIYLKTFLSLVTREHINVYISQISASKIHILVLIVQIPN